MCSISLWVCLSLLIRDISVLSGFKTPNGNTQNIHRNYLNPVTWPTFLHVVIDTWMIIRCFHIHDRTCSSRTVIGQCASWSQHRDLEGLGAYNTRHCSLMILPHWKVWVKPMSKSSLTNLEFSMASMSLSQLLGGVLELAYTGSWEPAMYSPSKLCIWWSHIKWPW